MAIRIMEEKDFPQLYRLHQAYFPEYSKYIMHRYFNSSCYNYVATQDDGTIIGYVMSVYLDTDEPEYNLLPQIIKDSPRLYQNEENSGILCISVLLVCNEFRGQGYGQQLVSTLIEAARRDQASSHIVLQVNMRNQSAIHLYEKLKFITDPKILFNYYDPGQGHDNEGKECRDAYIMIRNLSL